MKNIIRASILLIILTFLTFSSLQTVFAANETVSLNTNLGGSARYGMISGNYLYSLVGSRLNVHDVTDITSPIKVGSMSIPGKGRRMDVSGNTIFIACSEGGLVAVDISTPSSPSQISVTTFDTAERITNTFDVEIHGSLAYIADYNGFFILDITDPAAITTTGSFTAFEEDHPHVYGVHISGDYAYVCCEFDGLYIFNISDPTAITQESHYSGSSENNLSDQYYDSLRDGDYLYLAAGGAGVAILDVSDAENPAFVSILNNNYGGILGLVKVGNLIYPFSEFYDQPEIDVSDPANPVQTEEFDVNGHHSLGISHHNGYLILANATHGIRIFDISAGTLNQISEILTVGRVTDCEGSGDYAFVSAAQNGLKILDMTTPSEPVLVKTFELIGYANGLTIDNDIAYIAQLTEEGASGGLLEIVDISNPLVPVSLGSITLEGEPNDVSIQNNIAYVALQTKGLALVDVSTPSSPSLITSYDSDGSCHLPVFLGNYIIGADGVGGFFIAKPDGTIVSTVASNFDLGIVQDIAISDSAIFLPGTVAADGLSVYDISLPYSPVALTQIQSMTDRTEEGQIKAVTVFDSYLLLAESVGGLRLFDVSDPSSPVELASTLRTIQGDPVKVTYNHGQQLAYVSAQIIGLYIYDVTLPDPPEVNLEGRWVGTGLSDGKTISITAELDQDLNSLSGTITYFGSVVRQVSVNAQITAASTVNDIITEAAPSRLGVSTVQMNYAGICGPLDLSSMVTLLDTAVTSQLANETNPLITITLGMAQPFITSALAAENLSDQIAQLAIAEIFITMDFGSKGITAYDSLVKSAAFQESHVSQTIAQNQINSICSDYRDPLTLYSSIGDFSLNSAYTFENQEWSPVTLYSLSIANSMYETASQYYLTNKPSCPEFGISTINGYYEGTVNFLGIISGIFKVCAEEDAEGDITGDIFIELEASDEFMGGPIVEATNDTSTGVSIISGLFEVHIGDMEVPIEIKNWKYEPTSEKWVGEIYVEVQSTTGTITLSYVSEDCPAGWNGK